MNTTLWVPHGDHHELLTYSLATCCKPYSLITSRGDARLVHMIDILLQVHVDRGINVQVRCEEIIEMLQRCECTRVFLS